MIPNLTPRDWPWFGRLSVDLRASILMIVAFAPFSVKSAFRRRISVPQVILVRQVLALILLAPLFWTGRAVVLHPTGLWLLLARRFLAAGAMACGLTAILHIPFADATTICMADVLITTALASLILRESVGWRRWTATSACFAGVLVMTRPFGAGLDAQALVTLAGAAFCAASVIALRLGSGYDFTTGVMFWQWLVVGRLAAPLAPVHWVTPTTTEVAILYVMGVIFTAGNWLLTVAIRLGRASSLAPLGYLRLLVMAVIGWFIYAEVPFRATFIGGALVLVSASCPLGRNAASPRAFQRPCQKEPS